MSQKQTVTLDTPIKRGDQVITELTIRKPSSGELRGIALTDLLQMNVTSLTKILPRLTSPSVTEQDVARMDPADLVQCGSQVADFLLPKASKPDQSPEE
ncbi:phage tail assembly protein [Pseudomonas helleri]|uniref:phage tail assembly protein n=1 Tax=Pseudomonas helleri TaxID=1608996 RepID=UPI001297DC9C|nr:phage tail assembly protein [Pseudomonas helleri]MQT34863.1 phage tail assembly protein [Pseudomonas helleri]